MKVYAVYSIPKSPEYHLEKLFKTKEGAKDYIKSMKEYEKGMIYDILLEDVAE